MRSIRPPPTIRRSRHKAPRRLRAGRSFHRPTGGEVPAFVSRRKVASRVPSSRIPLEFGDSADTGDDETPDFRTSSDTHTVEPHLNRRRTASRAASNKNGACPRRRMVNAPDAASPRPVPPRSPNMHRPDYQPDATPPTSFRVDAASLSAATVAPQPLQPLLRRLAQVWYSDRRRFD